MCSRLSVSIASLKDFTVTKYKPQFFVKFLLRKGNLKNREFFLYRVPNLANKYLYNYFRLFVFHFCADTTNSRSQS